MPFSLRSGAFRPLGDIPKQYTCEGHDRAPPLAWTGAPKGTKSFALIMDDPDAPDPKAPSSVFVHWVIYDIPAKTIGLPEGEPYPPGARQGKNDWRRSGYGGPCPPIGKHRYFFKLYALDVLFGDMRMPTKQQLEKAMEGHIFEQTELIGTYEKTKRTMS